MVDVHSPLQRSVEHRAGTASGYLMLLVLLAAIAVGAFALATIKSGGRDRSRS